MSTCRLKIISSSHCSHCKLVKYPSQLLTKTLQCKDYRSLNPLVSQMHQCKLQGLTKTFMAVFNSLQTNDPLSEKIHHLDCLIRPTALHMYNFITQSAIKKRLYPAPSTLFEPISIQATKLDHAILLLVAKTLNYHLIKVYTTRIRIQGSHNLHVHA